MGRTTRMAEIHDAFRWAHESGLSTSAFFMIGYPGDTRRDREDVLRLACEIDPSWIVVAVTSRLREHRDLPAAVASGRLDARRLARLHARRLTDRIDTRDITFDGQDYRRDELEGMVSRLYWRFYLPLGQLGRVLREVRSARQIANFGRMAPAFGRGSRPARIAAPPRPAAAVPPPPLPPRATTQNRSCSQTLWKAACRSTADRRPGEHPGRQASRRTRSPAPAHDEADEEGQADEPGLRGQPEHDAVRPMARHGRDLARQSRRSTARKLLAEAAEPHAEQRVRRAPWPRPPSSRGAGARRSRWRPVAAMSRTTAPRPAGRRAHGGRQQRPTGGGPGGRPAKRGRPGRSAAASTALRVKLTARPPSEERARATSASRRRESRRRLRDQGHDHQQEREARPEAHRVRIREGAGRAHHPGRDLDEEVVARAARPADRPEEAAPGELDDGDGRDEPGHGGEGRGQGGAHRADRARPRRAPTAVTSEADQHPPRLPAPGGGERAAERRPRHEERGPDVRPRKAARDGRGAARWATATARATRHRRHRPRRSDEPRAGRPGDRADMSSRGSAARRRAKRGGDQIVASSGKAAASGRR